MIRRPSGNFNVTSVRVQLVGFVLVNLEAWLVLAKLLGAGDRGIKRCQSIEDGAEVGQKRIIIDKEIQRRIDAAEGLRSLSQHTQLNLAGKIKWRGDDIGDEGAGSARRRW